MKSNYKSKLVKNLFYLLCLVGCKSVQISDYEKEKPQLILENYLNGTLDAYGIFQDRSGLIVKRFECEIKASWKDGIGTLIEDFKYSDGTKSQRIWTIKKINESKYIGTAADVDGEAIGIVSGNAFQWKYQLKLPVNNNEYNVSFDDWMYLMNDKIMINKSEMSKWGLYLGNVTLTFVKR